MLTAVVFVPSTPLLVPELAGGAADETDGLRQAALSVCATLGPRWTVLGGHSVDAVLGAQTAGTFAAYGVDVAVTLGPGTTQAPDPELALPALTAGWLRGAAAPSASCVVRLVDADGPPARCAALGRALAAEPEPVGLVVVGDGASTLTEKAPGAFDERAPAVQAGIDQVLGSADVDVLAALDPWLCGELGVSGRAVWQVAAAAAGPGWRGRSVHTSAPYGVGYSVVAWER